MYEAPSRVLIEGLWASGASVIAHDPVGMDEARRIFGENPRLKLVNSAMTALDGADALVIVTEWQTFRSPDFTSIKEKLKQPIIFDGRNLYEPAIVVGDEIEYFPIGRAAKTKAANCGRT